ncbi:MAG: hypothetical protein KDA84_30755 [Planctomycetaceae bacterium]|nr:hypothetical protein [Planctomycetaceae bacterium]
MDASGKNVQRSTEEPCGGTAASNASWTHRLWWTLANPNDSSAAGRQPEASGFLGEPDVREFGLIRQWFLARSQVALQTGSHLREGELKDYTDSVDDRDNGN